MRLTVPVLSMLIVASCTSTPPDDRVEVENRALPGPSEEIEGGGLADIELCDAEDYRNLEGSNVDASALPVSENLRVFGVNDIVTQDYIPQRTNIVFDNTRTIVRVYCG